jgi:DNA-binding transcriptional LysR family regulator
VKSVGSRRLGGSRRACVYPSAVSQQIAALERELGVGLVERTAREPP